MFIYGINTTAIYTFKYKVTKRTNVTPSTTNAGAGLFPTTASTVTNSAIDGAIWYRTANATGAGYFQDSWTVNAEL